MKFESILVASHNRWCRQRNLTDFREVSDIGVEQDARTLLCLRRREIANSHMTEDAGNLMEALSAAGRLFHDRNWVSATSGNLSAVLTKEPLSLLITASGSHKGSLSPKDYLVVDGEGTPQNPGKPSAETALHLAIIHGVGAGSVFHTHSVWSSILADVFAQSGGIVIEGYEMLKGLSGVATHTHCEWVPILENSQDYQDLSADLTEVIKTQPHIHAVLLRRHGIYTWGKNIAEACRHIEVFEFLFEVLGRKHSFAISTRG